MIKKQLLDEAFIKSIESNYVFANNPINRLRSVPDGNETEIQLENLKNRISQIENCELKKNSNQLVFSDGNFKSKIMIIGEGPGEKEDLIGKPFVGDAGNLLNKMLAAINIDREKTYITNLVNYRPPNDRKPLTSEINRYSKFLIEHILLINPKIIIIMGNTAMEALVGTNTKISKERGKWKDILIGNKTFLSIITFHPAYLLRQPDQKRHSWSDLKEIKKKIDFLNINLN